MSGARFRIPLWITYSVWHEAHEGIRKRMQQRRLRGRDEGGEHRRLRRLQLGEVEPARSRAQRLIRSLRYMGATANAPEVARPRTRTYIRSKYHRYKKAPSDASLVCVLGRSVVIHDHACLACVNQL